MPRNLKSTIILSAVVILFAGCGKKEGAIDHRQKIDYVTAIENRYSGVENTLYYSTGEYTSEKWNWDGNEMYRIDYGGYNPYSENFYFDGRGRIMRTTVPAYRIRRDFFYDGRKLDKIECYVDDELFSNTSYLHGDGGLYEIVCTYYDTGEEKKKSVCPIANPLYVILGHEISDAVSQEICRLSSSDKGSNSEVRYKLSWNDNNLTYIQCVTNEGTVDISITYDDKRNPYRQLYGYRESDDELFGFKMMSENNILTIRMPYENRGMTLFSYDYLYDGKYPSQRRLSYSYEILNENTWDSVTVTFEKVENFYYQ